MERVYKREGILFKILPCLLIAMYVVMCIYGSTVCATDVADNEILISTSFYGDFTIPKPPEDLYYAFFMHTALNSRYGVFYVFSYEPIEFSIDYDNETITASSSSSVYGDGFSVGVKDVYISNLRNLNYNNIKSNLNSGNYKNTSLFNLRNGSTGSFASDITTVNNLNLKVSYDENNNLVFPGASQELAKTTMISTQITSVDFSQVLQEVLQTLLIALPVVILVIALMKAIKLLFQVLRNA